MTLSEIKARVRGISKEKAEYQLNNLVLNALAAQGDKKAIDKVLNDLKKALDS